MKFKPLHDRVLVKRVQSDEKTAGGIIIPDTAQEKPMEGEVLEVGSGSRNENGKLEPLDVKKGDKILFGKFFQNIIIIKFSGSANSWVIIYSKKNNNKSSI